MAISSCKYHLTGVLLLVMLVLTACHKQEENTVLKGVIEIGDAHNDFAEDPDVSDATIDSARAQGTREACEHPTDQRDDPTINQIEESDLQRARQELQAAGQEAKDYGMDKIIYPKATPIQHPRPDSL